MKNFVEKIKQAGVIGGGGAGFPTHIKYEAQGVEYVIVNGAECEPLLHVDKYLMQDRPAEIINALEEAIKALKAKGGFIAVKEKNKKSIASLTEELNKRQDNKIKIFTLGDFYPAGDEFVITYEVLGRIVQEGGIPIKRGVIVNNVFTYLNIHNALRAIPVTERIVTVNGWVKEPYTAFFPLGTSIKEAIKLAGGAAASGHAASGAKGDDYKVICGGPMMGKIIDDLDQPITQTTSGIIVLPSDHVLIRRKTRAAQTEVRIGRSACDQCRLCTDGCPRYLLGHDLEPHMIMRTLPYKNINSDIITSAYLCCECNLCAYFSCPLFLSPGVIAANLKKELARKQIKRVTNKKDDEYKVRIFRNFRRTPTKRLISRLGLSEFENDAKFTGLNYKPSQVRISLTAHIGAPSIPVVKPGAKVKKGDLIGVPPEGKLGVNIHASIDGKVTGIEGKYIIIERV